MRVIAHTPPDAPRVASVVTAAIAVTAAAEGEETVAAAAAVRVMVPAATLAVPTNSPLLLTLATATMDPLD